jgi:hypothetical protein
MPRPVRKWIVRLRMWYADLRGHHGKRWDYEPSENYMKKKKKTESEKMQEELEPIGILKRGKTSWAMDVNFRFPRRKQRDGKKK